MITRLKELLFINKSVRQTIAKNIFWLAVSQVGSRFIRAIIIIYAARVLGAAEYGIFAYVMGLATFFTLFTDIGVSPLLTRDIASHPEKKNEYFTSSFWIKIFLLLITVFLVVFVAPYFTSIDKAKNLIALVAFLVAFDGLRDFLIAYLRGLQKMELEAMIVIVMNITIVITGFIILNISATAESLIWAYLTSVAAATLLAIFILRKQLTGIFRYFNKYLSIQTLKFCWPIAFSGMIGIFMLNTDIIMLGWWRTAEEIGYYSAGQRLVQIFYTLPIILASAIFPIISRLVKQNEKEKLKIINEKSMLMVFLIAIPLVTGGIILAQPIFELIFGRAYLPGIPAFRILLTTLFLMFPITLIGNLILAYNQQKKTFIYSAAGAFGNILFNTLLIPSYGIVGAAIATITAQSLNYGLTWRFVKKINDFQTFRYLKKIIAGAIIMGIFSFILNKSEINVIINIILSAGIYFGTLYLLKERILLEIKSLIKNP